MIHIFSDLEGIRIAIEMERRGESFYRRAAKVSKSEDTIAMLNSLANDEKRHQAEFERLYKAESEAGMSDKAYDDETNAYLTAIAAEVVFPKGLMALKSEGFEKALIPAGTYAAFTTEKGTLAWEEFPRLFGLIYEMWLPGSGYRLAADVTIEVMHLWTDYEKRKRDRYYEIWIPVERIVD